MLQSCSLKEHNTTMSLYMRTKSEANNNDKELHGNMMQIFFLMQSHIISAS